MASSRRKRLDVWMDEEVALIRQIDPTMGETSEAEYRESLRETLHGAQLKLADDFDALCRATHVEEIGDRVYAHLKSISLALRWERIVAAAELLEEYVKNLDEALVREQYPGSLADRTFRWLNGR